MKHPEINMPATEGSTHSVVPAASWGEKEEARQIALLDALVCLDNIHRVEKKVIALEESGESENGLNGKSINYEEIDNELRQSYLDYAMSVIINRSVNPEKAAGQLRVISRRSLYCSMDGDFLATELTLCEIKKQALRAALAILRLKQAAKNCIIASLLIKLINSAKSASLRLPLFAYGPELSEYRHRLR